MYSDLDSSLDSPFDSPLLSRRDESPLRRLLAVSPATTLVSPLDSPMGRRSELIATRGSRGMELSQHAVALMDQRTSSSPSGRRADAAARQGHLRPELEEALALITRETDTALPLLSEQCTLTLGRGSFSRDAFLGLRWREPNHPEPAEPEEPSSELLDPRALEQAILTFFSSSHSQGPDDLRQCFDAVRGALAAVGDPPELMEQVADKLERWAALGEASADAAAAAAAADAAEARARQEEDLMNELSLLFLQAADRAAQRGRVDPEAGGGGGGGGGGGAAGGAAAAGGGAVVVRGPPLEARLRHVLWSKAFTAWLCSMPRARRRAFAEAVGGDAAARRIAALDSAERRRRGDDRAALTTRGWRRLLGVELARLSALLLERPADASAMLQFAAHQAASWRSAAVPLPPFSAHRLLHDHACARLWLAEAEGLERDGAPSWMRAQLLSQVALFHELLLQAGAMLVRCCAEGTAAADAVPIPPRTGSPTHIYAASF